MGSGSYFYQLLYICTIVCLYVFLLTTYVSSLQPSCSDHERLALLQFQRNFHIDCAFSLSPSARPKVKSWTVSDNEDCCSWDGVDCDEETGKVIRLDLSSSCLRGPFLPNNTLFSLSHLIELNLADNHFNFSPIPSQFEHFHKLQSLNLSNSAFSGQIPIEITKLSKLSTLDLSNSYIPAYSALNLRLHDPSIDKFIQNLTSLQILNLEMVDMSSNFPTILSNLTSLKVLNLPLCNLCGELPPNLFRLPHLEVLHMGGNIDLAGFLPEFQWHSPLKELSLSLTSLSGELPPSIGKLTHLRKLVLENSQFLGLLPSSLGNLTTLTHLFLEGNSFHGDIPFSLANLTNLQMLFLSNLNVKPGQLFLQLPTLHKLIGLGLDGIKLNSETLYLLANFTKLEILSLEKTNLEGPFPKMFANLTKLNELSLKGNKILGEIPQWISQLNNLNLLHLAGNNMYVKFETFLNSKNLQFLDLTGSHVTFPPISKTNVSLLQLEYLGLTSCNLTEFPRFLHYQNVLQILLLDHNNIRGSVPLWFFRIASESLLVIDISNNKLTSFQEDVVTLPWNNLIYIDISYNRLQIQLPIPPNSIKCYLGSSNLIFGEIPAQICNAKSLISLDLSSNMLCGKIPHCIAKELDNSLEIFDLRSNSLTGTIPPSFTRACKLKMINLSNNELKGVLPRSIVNCSMLAILDIGKNHFVDTFPSWLRRLSKLQVLVLSHNSFHGKIVEKSYSTTDFRSLSIIDLSHNRHNGHLPSRYLRNWHEMEGSMENQSNTPNGIIISMIQVGPYSFSYEAVPNYSITITNKGSERLYMKVLKVFRVVDFSSNNFTGKIPDIIGNLQGLQALNLSNNNLNGPIPPSLANITDLESLDLSRNILSGEIPLALSQLTSLEVFNVSYNQLEGPIPIGNQFNTFDNSSFQGNVELCGKQVCKECGNANVPKQQAVVTQDEVNNDYEFVEYTVKSFGFLSGCVVGYVIGELFIADKYHQWFMESFRRLRLRRRVQRAPIRRR